MHRNQIQTLAIFCLFSMAACEQDTPQPGSQPQANQDKPQANKNNDANKAADNQVKPESENQDPKKEAENNEEEDADQDNKENAEAPPATFAVSAATLTGTLCEGAGEAGNGKQTVIITNSKPEPGQPIDYVQVTFDALSVTSKALENTGDCVLNVFAEWTPGHRLVLNKFRLDGTSSTTNKTSDGLAKLKLDLRSGYSSSTTRLRSFSGTDGDDFDEGFDFGPEKIYSSCTGAGVFSFGMDLNMQIDDEGEGYATVDRVSGLFRLAKPGEVPDC